MAPFEFLHSACVQSVFMARKIIEIFYLFRIKTKNAGRRKKCGKECSKVLHSLHDCRTVDTCVVYLLEDAFKMLFCLQCVACFQLSLQSRPSRRAAWRSYLHLRSPIHNRPVWPLRWRQLIQTWHKLTASYSKLPYQRYAICIFC